MDISVTMKVIILKCSMCYLNIFLEGSMSQNFDLGLSICFMLKKKTGNIIFVIFFIIRSHCKELHHSNV